MIEKYCGGCIPTTNPDHPMAQIGRLAGSGAENPELVMDYYDTFQFTLRDFGNLAARFLILMLC